MTNYKSVQIVENELFYYCSELREEYPNLTKEIMIHDKCSNSSWYELSEEAALEYKIYTNDGKKYSDYIQDLRYPKKRSFFNVRLT